MQTTPYQARNCGVSSDLHRKTYGFKEEEALGHWRTNSSTCSYISPAPTHQLIETHSKHAFSSNPPAPPKACEDSDVFRRGGGTNSFLQPSLLAKCILSLSVSEWGPQVWCLTDACCFRVDGSQWHTRLAQYVTRVHLFMSIYVAPRNEE